jgi:hypothetical protein
MESKKSPRKKKLKKCKSQLVSFINDYEKAIQWFLENKFIEDLDN